MTPALAALQTCYCLQGTRAGGGTTAFMTLRHLLELSASESRWGQGGAVNGGPQTPSLSLCPLSWQPALGRGDRRPLNCRCLDHQQEEDPASSPPWEGLPCISASTSQPLQATSPVPAPLSACLPCLFHRAAFSHP